MTRRLDGARVAARMVRCLMSNMDESARETSARITKWIDERDARIRRETIEECIDELILLQGHYTQEQINADKIALFWTRGVHRSIEKLRALSEDRP